MTLPFILMSMTLKDLGSSVNTFWLLQETFIEMRACWSQEKPRAYTLSIPQRLKDRLSRAQVSGVTVVLAEEAW